MKLLLTFLVIISTVSCNSQSSSSEIQKQINELIANKDSLTEHLQSTRDNLNTALFLLDSLTGKSIQLKAQIDTLVQAKKKNEGLYKEAAELDATIELLKSRLETQFKEVEISDDRLKLIEKKIAELKKKTR